MPITPRELVSWSRQDNVELYRGDNQQHVDTKTGWFGGRMARNHKIKSGEEDRTLKQQAYKNAQDDVFSALERIYGKRSPPRPGGPTSARRGWSSRATNGSSSTEFRAIAPSPGATSAR
jgi:hypothetical protein